MDYHNGVICIYIYRVKGLEGMEKNMETIRIHSFIPN